MSGSTNRARRVLPHPVEVQRRLAWESQNPASARPSGWLRPERGWLHPGRPEGWQQLVQGPPHPVPEGPEVPVRLSRRVAPLRPVQERHFRAEAGKWWGSEVDCHPYGVSSLGADPSKFALWWSYLGQAIVSCSG